MEVVSEVEDTHRQKQQKADVPSQTENFLHVVRRAMRQRRPAPESKSWVRSGARYGASRMRRRGAFGVAVAALDSFPVRQLPAERLVVYVVSTTGQGDVPDNMARC